jgi:hypothetical protein
VVATTQSEYDAKYLDNVSARTAFESLDRILSLDEAESFGFDGTGRDLDPRYPYTLRDALRKQLSAVANNEMCAEPLCTAPPTGSVHEFAWVPLCRKHAEEALDEIDARVANDSAPFYSGYES